MPSKCIINSILIALLIKAVYVVNTFQSILYTTTVTMSWLKQPIYYNSDISYYHTIYYTVSNEGVYMIHQLELYCSYCKSVHKMY